MELIKLLKTSELEDRVPKHALANNTDLVIVKYDDTYSVLYGRCFHRGALM
jgi:nitrite reductase/ring-hydroxylating ferredoxin subunit